MAKLNVTLRWQSLETAYVTSYRHRSIPFVSWMREAAVGFEFQPADLLGEIGSRADQILETLTRAYYSLYILRVAAIDRSSKSSGEGGDR